MHFSKSLFCAARQQRNRLSLTSFVGVGMLLSMFMWPATESFSGEIVALEYEIKAAMLYKLNHFVTWPSKAKHEAGTQLFCAAKSDPFAKYLEALSAQVESQFKIQVRYLPDDLQGMEACQLIFASKSADPSIPIKLEVSALSSVLTISDVHGFAKAGGMIEIIRRNQRLGFVVNMQAVKKSGLHLAAPLLQMSTLIYTEKTP